MLMSTTHGKIQIIIGDVGSIRDEGGGGAGGHDFESRLKIKDLEILKQAFDVSSIL